MSDSNDDTVPVVHGDGIHDDAPAIQAAIDGRPYKDPRGVLSVLSFGPLRRAITAINCLVSAPDPDEGGG